MIRKLRWKFLSIMMAIFTILLITVFVMLYYSTKLNYRQRSIETLHTAVMENFPNDNSLIPPPRREETPMFVADKKDDGTITVIKNRLSDMEDSQAEELISLTEGQTAASGTLKDQQLRYLYDRKPPGNVTRYVFMDISAETDALSSQITHSLIIGAGALAAFFLFSFFLSKWMVKPVEEAWKRQRQFVADASHELKTPLTIISSNIGLLSQTQAASDPKNSRRIGCIQAETVRMKQLVESLLTLARHDSDGITAGHLPLDFSFIVESCVMTMEPVAFDMKRSLSAEVEKGIQVKGDEKRLRQLVDILLDNACKYSSENSQITVRLKRIPSKEVCLLVSNEGTPLTKEEIKNIFLRFYRGDPARSSVPGYGLGLSIAKSIAEEHRGKIEACSDGSGRNHFTVTLPLI